MGDGKELAQFDPKVPSFTMNNNLTVNDLLAVAVGEAENKLNAELRKTQASIKKSEAELKSLAKELDETVEKLPEVVAKRQDIKVLDTHIHQFFSPDNIRATVSTNIDSDRKAVILSWRLEGASSGNQMKKQLPFTSDIIRIMDLIDSENQNLGALREHGVETRKRLANIPALERRYRSRLVSNQLQKSAAGKDILKVITDGIDDELLTL